MNRFIDSESNASDNYSNFESSGPDFDYMLSSLDASIQGQPSQEEIQPSIGQFLGDLQRDLEALIASQVEKIAKQRRESRLSVMYNAKEAVSDIDSGKLFLSFKDIGHELSRLESVS